MVVDWLNDPGMGPTDRNHWELVNTTLEELRSGRYNGALLAIDEFNQRAEPRRLAKIEGLVHTLPGSQSAERWPDAMYLAHVFDHPTYSAYEGTALVNRLDLHGESS